MQVLDTRDVSGELRCYDCHGDTLTLGTDTGHILCWSNRGVGDHEAILHQSKAVLRRRPVDKVYTRHDMVIVMQVSNVF